MSWNDFDRFDEIINKYMEATGEGNTLASQIVTAVNKLVYKWFNDGDVFDNTHYMTGWCNDLSSYANWLYKNAPATDGILLRINDVKTEDEYEYLLHDLCVRTLNENYLSQAVGVDKTGSIYDCEGPFEFDEHLDDEDEDYDDWEDEYDDEEDDDEDY